MNNLENKRGVFKGHCNIIRLALCSSSDYAELTEHSCFTDYSRNLNGFGLTAIGLAP